MGHLNMKASQIGVRHGLSQGLINFMAFDNDGYLWITTNDGLNRYDGASVRVFRHDPDDSLSVTDNRLRAVMVDRKNRVWVSTPSGKLDLFDRKNESFIHLPDTTKHGIISDIRLTGWLCEDTAGNIIIATFSGYKVVTVVSRGPGEPTLQVRGLTDVYPAVSCLGDPPLPAIMKFTVDGTLLFNRLDTMYLFSPAVLAAKGKPAMTIGNITNIFTVGNISADVYIDSAHKVIKRFDAAKGQFVTVYKIPANIRAIGPSIDQEGRLWLQQLNGHIWRVDLATGKTDDIEMDLQDVEPVARTAVGELIADKNGNLVFPTSGYGVIKILGASEKFLHYPEPTMLRTMALAGDGRVFDERIYDKWRGLWKKYLTVNGGRDVATLSDQLGYDRNGCYWSRLDSPQVAGIVKMNPVKGKPELMVRRKNTYFGQPVIIDKQNDIWYPAHDKTGPIYFCHFSQRTGEEETFTFPVTVESVNGHFISDWYQQADGVFWLATRQGVFSFDPRSKAFKQYSHNDGEKKSLASGKVLSICADPRDPEHYLWAGTAGGGLNKLDKTTGNCIHYTTTEGLPNNVIYGIQADAHKNLWLSTNNGLCLFYPGTGDTRNFTIKDGLPHNEFNTMEIAHDTTGKLYFGGINGWVGFDPERFYTAVLPPKVTINRLELNNNEVVYKHSPVTNSEYLLPAPIEHCKELVLGPDVTVFTIGYSIADMNNQQEYRYKYKLEGFDKDWVDAGSRHEATFTNMAPGTYTFKVLGRNSEHVWSTSPAELKIIIQPPWWATWWFRIIVVAMIISAAYTLYRYRVKQLLKIERLRNTIALNLHDDIGSTLSSISLYAAVLKKKANGLTDESNALIDKMIANTSEIMENMNDIVWATKEDMGSFEPVIDRMRNFAVEMTEVGGTELVFNNGKNTDQLTLQMQQRKNIYMFYKEAVNNAIKHSGCSCLTIDITYVAGILTVSVRDNGKGMNNAAAIVSDGNGGSGLLGMKFRADQIGAHLEISSSPETGTVLSLLVPVR